MKKTLICAVAMLVSAAVFTNDAISSGREVIPFSAGHELFYFNNCTSTCTAKAFILVCI